MKEITDTASSLHNWRQRHGLFEDKPGRPSTSPGRERRKLEVLLASSIDKANHRTIAEAAGMNALDLIETAIMKPYSLGLRGLQAAIQVHENHGIVACLQYLYSL